MLGSSSNRGRGWDRAERSMPASEYDIRIGAGLLSQDSAGWPAYVVVTTPSSYRTAQPYLATEPKGVAYVEWSDAIHLREVSDSLPQNAELVIGLGGGRALDASKYVALDKGVPLLLVPSILSSGAIIHGSQAIWEGRKLIGNRTIWPWVDPEYVLVDCDLVLEAPHYLNTAGLADVLCGYSGIAEWRRNLRLGRASVDDAVKVDAQAAYLTQLADTLADSLTTEGNLSEASIRLIMKAIQDRDSRGLRVPGAISADHTFWQVVELANDRSWVHGEMVALGAHIIAWRCGDPEPFRTLLDKSLIRRKPSQMGMSLSELERGLELIVTSASDPRFRALDNSVLRQEPITGAAFDELWDYLEA